MDLGTKLRQARLEKGLSQKALCGDAITRNMLSQIENGSANPSMATLRYLASRLELPLSYFLEEQVFLSPNRELMAKARAAQPQQVLAILEDYQAPDDCFDPERYLLEILACLRLAQQALESRPSYALTLLAQAEAAGKKTPYYTDALARQLCLLRYRADPARAGELEKALPSDSGELLLRAEAALQAGQPDRCLALLSAADPSPRQCLLMGQAHMSRQEYAEAIPHFQDAEAFFPRQVFPALERCYLQLENYKMAYHYADKGRKNL